MLEEIRPSPHICCDMLHATHGAHTATDDALMAGLPWGLDFNPHTHPIPTEKSCGNPTESPYPQKPQNLPYKYPTPFIISLDAYFSCLSCVLSDAVHMTELLYVFSNDNERKIKNVIKTNSKFDSIRGNSKIDNDIYRIFNAFLLNLTSIQKSHRIPTGPWGFITVPIPIPYPYPWESRWDSLYPRQPWLMVRSHHKAGRGRAGRPVVEIRKRLITVFSLARRKILLAFRAKRKKQV